MTVRRYVILFHDWPFPHWDLMLEAEDHLLTWRVLDQPQLDRQLAIEPLPPHRKRYLDYEGPLSGDRGCVVRWDEGTVLDGGLDLSLESPRHPVGVVIQSRRFTSLIRVFMTQQWIRFEKVNNSES